MSGVKLMVLYPQSKDLAQFEKDYQQHLALFHQQTMSSPAMQMIAADAVRISSGGAPTVLMGSES
jgi:hypothetical protein